MPKDNMKPEYTLLNSAIRRNTNKIANALPLVLQQELIEQERIIEKARAEVRTAQNISTEMLFDYFTSLSR
jgi:hypothetical protein